MRKICRGDTARDGDPTGRLQRPQRGSRLDDRGAPGGVSGRSGASWTTTRLTYAVMKHALELVCVLSAAIGCVVCLALVAPSGEGAGHDRMVPGAPLPPRR